MFKERQVRRLRKIESVIVLQRAFLHRVPDPDTRERAEMHLFELIEMRDRLEALMQTIER